MNKILTVAAIALVAASCSKKSTEPQPAPGPEVDATAPVSFGATANTEVTPTKATTLGGESGSLNVNLGIYAFKGATLPADPTAAAVAGVVWSDATNLEYAWNNATGVKCYQEVVPGTPSGSKAKLFWPGTGTTGNNLSFASYFPFVATAASMPATGKQQAYVKDYKLIASLSDQTTQSGESAPYNYGFAWASLLDIARPAPVAAKALVFNYKVAKLTLIIKGDDTTIGDDADGIKISAGGATDKGLKSIKVFSTTSGLCSDYSLDLLKGTVDKGATVTDKDHPILVQPVENPGQSTPSVIKPYIDATAYLVPALAADLNSDATPANQGIMIEVVYNDGVQDYTVRAPINSTTVTNPSGGGKADLTAGLEAGKNYKYTLKLGKSGITFTGTVTDWVDVAADGEIPLE